MIHIEAALVIYGLVCFCSLDIAINQSPALANGLNCSSMHSSQTDTLLVDPKIQQLVERQAQAWETADSKQIIADFTDDCLFAVPGSRFRGKQEVKDAADSYFAEFMETKVTIKRIITNGNEGAIEWIWSEKNKETGEKTQAEDAIIFELEGGKIKYWREYIDKKSIS
ncbi:hypothetical protein Mic7113_1321 [Allocoleopsis franciscana PCC 7113]|uniref:SnoaL-like domain-containing protein n=2 Tax=Allocoleopsis TaxID=2886347 RepID=K9WBL9_9CYAN|nr:hypothetical protein Mic7113_1321 [Allocoleopsis franciscana PCC 7113]